MRANLGRLGADTETTGLQMYAPGFKVRLAQFGNGHEAYVLPVEYGGPFELEAKQALIGARRLVFQNGMFDLQVIDAQWNLRLETMWPKVTDTQILAKLIDPRATEHGGIGSSLEDLTRHYVDETVADEVKTLMTKLAKQYKTTKDKIWSLVDLDNEDYNLYAGMDAILAFRLLDIQSPRVPVTARPLVEFEHSIAEICSYMERTGFLLDVEYAEQLSYDLHVAEEKYSDVALRLGCENVNSNEQVADVLEHRGVVIPDRTPTGKRKVDKGLLGQLVSTGDEFAIAVTEAKKARKWRTTWVDTFLAQRDENDRCHAHINTLQARTGRMSITGIPAQTLPAGDWIIRRCFLAECDHRATSVDYQAQELRVLAALSNDERMIQAFINGDDLHLITAQAAFGQHITKDDPERKYGKVGNFQKVYGGGAAGLAKQIGIPLETAQSIHSGFNKAYPGVTKFSRQLQSQARTKGSVVTASGRRLPVDPLRAYSALNYMVQSTSRDVTCRGLVKLHKAGYTPYLRLPIHDEVVASLPAEHAEWGAKKIAGLMAETMGPVFIGTDAEVGLRSWGSLYGADY